MARNKKPKRRKQKPAPPSQLQTRPGWLKRTWEYVKWWQIAGFVLSTALGLFAMKPQLSVAAGTRLDPTQTFTVPFTVTNDGLIDLSAVEVSCYASEVQLQGIQLRDTIMDSPGVWSAKTLERGEAQTVVCSMSSGPRPPLSADIAVIVEFHSMLFGSSARVFRFVGQRNSSGVLELLRQPAAPIEDAARAALARAKVAHKEMEEMRQRSRALKRAMEESR